jgi:hypothetical protein
LKSKVKIFIAALMLTLVYAPLMSQTAIGSDTLNRYTNIEELVFRSGNIPDAVRVSSTDGFQSGDTVMVYQPKGFPVDDRENEAYAGTIGGYIGYTGKYSLLIIHEINLDTIIFNNATGFNFPPLIDQPYHYEDGDVGQLIRVPSYDNAVVSSTLSAKDWDPVSNTGGVLVFFVKEKLTLNAPIDVSGQGFKGGNPGTDEYNGLCYTDDTDEYSKFFYLSGEVNKAGLKGEGAADTTFAKTRGKASLLNGGGGGNAKFSGGGGGSNFSEGGAGGNESGFCTATSGTTNGLPGYSFGDDGRGIYYNDDDDNVNGPTYANRIFLGGGGGSGTQHIGNGFPASQGGNGGGIVIIIADTLESTLANPILAKGESVLPAVAGSGAGGGAGGCIVLDISHYEGEIKLNAEGGDGGHTNGAVFTGPGGGGGGGIYWLRKDSTNINHTNVPGQEGRYNGIQSPPTGGGDTAAVLEGIRLPLDGFLFNTLPRDQNVCSDETPDPINASDPKGGDVDDFSYEWYSRLVTETDWVLDGTSTLVGYTFSGPLTESTEYKRTVRSGSLESSDSLTYTVLQKIEGNAVLAHDTVCFGSTALPLHHNVDSILGGAKIGTDTRYRWISSVDGGSSWETAGGADSLNASFVPMSMETTTVFSRVVKSGVCDDTSNQITITVLPAIENNEISQDTILCFGQTPDELIGTKPAGGDAALFSYKWEVADLITGPYTEEATTQHYAPSFLEESKFYRRVYYSGIHDACRDTTNILTVEVLPLINNNQLVASDDTMVCQLDALPGDGIAGLLPGGGREGIYTYIWQVSDDKTIWGDSATFSANDPFNLTSFPAESYIRRLVKSGEDDVCQDTSEFVTVYVVPAITDNTISTADFTICQDIELPVLAAENVVGGGATTGYRWKKTIIDGANVEEFTDAGGADSNENSYTPGALQDTTWFVRYAWSLNDDREICESYSNILKVTVPHRIENNLINGGDLEDSICYGSDLIISGSGPGTDPELIYGEIPGVYDYDWQKSATIDGTYTSDVLNTDTDFDETAIEQLEPIYLRRIVTSGVCTSTSDILEMYVRRLPNGVLDLADGQDIIICESDIIPLSLKIDLDGELDVTNYFIKLTYDSEEGTGTIDTDEVITNPGIVEYYPFTDDSATYIFALNAIVDNYGCVAPPDSMTGSASVKVYQTPEPEIMPLDTGVCGQEVSLNAFADRGGMGHWILKSGNLNAVFAPDDFESTDVTTDILTTDFEVMEYGWVLETPRCVDTAFVEIVHYKDPDHPPYFLPQDTVVEMYFSSEWVLEAVAPTAGGGYWRVADGSYGSVTDLFSNPTTATNLELEETSTFVWTVSNPMIIGSEVCGPYEDELPIVRHDLTQYEGFSPGNGDGLNMNDFYVMRGLKFADDFTFIVYNNWGSRIRTVTRADVESEPRITEGDINYPDGNGVENELALWNGTLSDGISMAPDGVYYYSISIQLDGLMYSKKGSIVLKSRE